MANIPLKGSERALLPGARALKPTDPTERIEVTILVRRRARQDLATRVAAMASGRTPGPCLSRDEFAKRHGADAADIAAVRAFAAAHGLAVEQEHVARRTVVLSGTVAQFNAAFGVQLQQMSHANGSYRGRTGPILLPADLADVVEAVLGLDSRPQASPHGRVRRPAASGAAYTPIQVASAYEYPSGTGQGQCVALIELGGGFRLTDLDTYFKGLGVSTPSVVAVSVDHATNSPTSDANGPDGEVMLDVEVVGAIAPGANIVVYFAPNTDAGFLDAITTAVHDTTHKPSVISISWGGP
jgi:kumamolisin